MRKDSISIDKLKKFCLDQKIIVAPGADRTALEAAIARSGYHLQSVDKDAEIGCFGFWEQDDVNCGLCDAQTGCFRASIGEDKAKYQLRLKRLENPKLRFKAALKKKR